MQPTFGDQGEPSPREAHLNVGAGDRAAFSVAANGSGTLGYQWKKDGVDIPGATSLTFDITAALPENAGAYDCMGTLVENTP